MGFHRLVDAICRQKIAITPLHLKPMGIQHQVRSRAHSTGNDVGGRRREGLASIIVDRLGIGCQRMILGELPQTPATALIKTTIARPADDALLFLHHHDNDGTAHHGPSFFIAGVVLYHQVSLVECQLNGA